MATSISANNGAGSTSPTLILGYDTSVESRNVVHDLIGGGIAVTLVAPRPRSGELQLYYPDEADAWAALALHREETSFTLTNTDRPGVGMTYVLGAGGLRLGLDPETRDDWVVTVSYQEVEA